MGGVLEGVVLLCALPLSSLLRGTTKQSVLPMSFLSFLAAGRALNFVLTQSLTKVKAWPPPQPSP